MPARYFFGKSVKDNRVSLSSARSFAELVKKHLENAFPLAKTREQFHKLESKADRLDAKDGSYLTACTFKEDHCSRSHENIGGECNLLCLDVDATADARLLLDRPESLIKSLGTWNFAAYTTASSTPESPRLRVVVDSEGLPVTCHREAVQMIGARLGLSAVTKESLVPNQPMILPCRFLDDDPELFSPLIERHLKGRAFTIKDLENEDKAKIKPRDDLEPVVGSKVTRAQGFHGDGEDDGLEYLRTPLAGFTLELAKEALNHISSNCGRPLWIELAACLKHQFGHTDDAGKAFDIFNEWSGGGDNYAGEEDVLYNWESLKPTPSGRLPVTARTLVKRAHDAGWNVVPVKAACFKAVHEWITQEAKSVDDLVIKALEMIAGLPAPTASEEGRLLSAIRTQLLDHFREKVSIQDLKNDLKHLRNKRDRAKEDDNKKKEPACLTGWCFVTKDEKFVRPVTGQRISADAVDKAYGREFLPDPKKALERGEEMSDDEKSRPTLLPHLYLLNVQQCLICDDYIYDPTNATNAYPTDPSGLRLVNTYRPCRTQPDKDQMPKAQEMWWGHLTNLIKEEEYRRIITDYIAYMVQFPGRKIRWNVLIQGTEGCGKSLIAKILAAILGDDNVKMVSNDILKSQWTEWATGSQAVILSEIRVSGQNRHDIMNRLKEATTDDRIPINQRGKDARTVPNVTNYIGFTNFSDALAVGDGSRRWFVVKSPLQTKQQVAALGESYFDRLFDDVNQNPGGYRAFFEEWPISSDFNADGRAPETIYLAEMIEDSADHVSSALRELIDEKEHTLVAEDLISQTILKELLDTREPVSYIKKVLRENHYSPVTGRTTISGVKHRLWTRIGAFPGLEAKDIFEVARKRHEGQAPSVFDDEGEEWI